MKEIKLFAVFGVVAVIIALVFTVNKNRQAEIERRAKKAETQRVERLIGQCQHRAHLDYKDRWERSCQSRGLSDDCRLPSKMANDYDKERGFEEQRCIERYK